MLLYYGLKVVKNGFFVRTDKSSEQIDKPQQVDEAVWQAWLKKNRARDRVTFERRLTIWALVMVFLTVSMLLWKFVG
jgi:hypothetical protein